MKSRLFALTASAALAFASVASAQSAPHAEVATAAPDVPDKLDLQTAIRYAVENNFAIRQARERIREQEGLIIEVRAQALPNVTLNSFYQRNANELSYDRTEPGFPVSTQNWQILLGVRQLLYSGGGVRAALDAATVVRQAAILDLEATINTALLDVRTRFYNVLLAREQIKVQEANVDLLQQQLQIAKNRFEAGASSNFEVLRAQVALANAQPPLINARNAYRNAIDALRQSIGYSNPRAENLNKIPEFVGDLSFEPVSFDLATALASAREHRPELLRLEKLEDARKDAVKNARSNYLPNLSVQGGYEFRKNAFSPHTSDMLDGWVAELDSNWAIFDGGATRGRVAQARSQLRQAQLTTDETYLAIEVQVRSALSALQDASELAQAAQQVVGQAEEALRLADARYAAGTVTQLDVLQAHVDLTTSRLNQIQANYQYNVAVANLREAIGQADPFFVRQQ